MGLLQEGTRKVVVVNAEQLVMVGSKPNSHKYIGTRTLVQGRSPDTAIVYAGETPVPESVFNSSQATDMIAVLKNIQAKSDSVIVRNGGKGSADIVFYYINGDAIQVTGDVQLGVYDRRTGELITHNKPPKSSTRESIFQSLLNTFGIATDAAAGRHIYGHINNGEAALVLSNGQRRGMAGTIISGFECAPFTADQLALYAYGHAEAVKRGYFGSTDALQEILGTEVVDDEMSRVLLHGYTLEELMRTNHAVRWEHPVLRRNLRSILGVEVIEDAFPLALDTFSTRAQGVPPERQVLIDEAIVFAHSGAYGDMTDDVAGAMGQYSEFSRFNFEPGNWQRSYSIGCLVDFA